VDVERTAEKTAENVPHVPASVSERNEACENTERSVSTEGPDSSDAITPDSAGNINAAPSAGTDVDICLADKPTVIDSSHLNTGTVTPNLMSPVGSPVHVVRTLITQDDPLGVFTNTVTSTSNKAAIEPRSSRSSDDVVKSARMEEESILMRRISEDTLGRSSWVAAATDSALRKCSSLNRLSSEYARSQVSPATSTSLSQVAPDSGAQPSMRTSLLGCTFRSAASRFASKYREIWGSMAPPGQPTKVLPSEASQEHCVSDAAEVVSSTVTSDSVDVTAPKMPDAPCTTESTDTVSKPVPDITVTTQSGKSRLRVPTALYSPLGKHST